MKELRFNRHNSTHWAEYKRIYQAMFCDEVERRACEEARRLLQAQIYEEFDLQIGAARYERTPTRRDERNGKRLRKLEMRGGYVVELEIPRARKMDIRFGVLDKWQRVEPKVLTAIVKAYLLGRSSRCAQEIVEAFGHSRFSRTFFTRLVRQFEERLEEFHTRALSNWPYVFIDGMAVRVWDSYLPVADRP